MKYLRNPVTGEVQMASPLMAKRLSRYQWTYVTKADWIEYKRAQVQALIHKRLEPMRIN